MNPEAPEVLYRVTVEDTTNGSVAAEPQEAEAGKTVTLTVTPGGGYRLKPGSLTVNGGEVALSGSGPYAFVMPRGDARVSAEFEALPAEEAAWTLRFNGEPSQNGTISLAGELGEELAIEFRKEYRESISKLSLIIENKSLLDTKKTFTLVIRGAGDSDKISQDDLDAIRAMALGAIGRELSSVSLDGLTMAENNSYAPPAPTAAPWILTLDGKEVETGSISLEGSAENIIIPFKTEYRTKTGTLAITIENKDFMDPKKPLNLKVTPVEGSDILTQEDLDNIKNMVEAEFEGRTATVTHEGLRIAEGYEQAPPAPTVSTWTLKDGEGKVVAGDSFNIADAAFSIPFERGYRGMTGYTIEITNKDLIKGSAKVTVTPAANSTIIRAADFGSMTSTVKSPLPTAAVSLGSGLLNIGSATYHDYENPAPVPTETGWTLTLGGDTVTGTLSREGNISVTFKKSYQDKAGDLAFAVADPSVVTSNGINLTLIGSKGSSSDTVSPAITRGASGDLGKIQNKILSKFPGKTVSVTRQNLDEADSYFDYYRSLIQTELAALSAKITEGTNAKSGVVASADGSDVLNTAYWVTPARNTALAGEISAAQNVYNASVSKTEVVAKTTALTAAITDFNNAKQAGKINKAALQAAITAANTAKSGVVASADGSTVSNTLYYVSQTLMTGLESAIAAAQNAYDTSMNATEVTGATGTLTTATTNFTNTKQLGEVNKAALQTAISAANTAKSGVATSNDGTDIPTTQNWVTAAQMTALESAISAANTAMNKNGSAAGGPDQSAADTAASNLATATTLFNSQKQYGTQAIKTALQSAISAANAAKSGVAESADGTDVPTTQKWVTLAQMTAFNTAISAAEAVFNNSSATQSQVDDAVQAINTATANFASQKQDGSKVAVDKTALQTAITAASAVNTGAFVTSVDGTDVPQGTYWVTSAEKSSFDSALSTANTVSLDPSATQSQVNVSATALGAALLPFTTNKKDGTYAPPVDLPTFLWEGLNVKYDATTNNSEITVLFPWNNVSESDAPSKFTALKTALNAASPISGKTVTIKINGEGAYKTFPIERGVDIRDAFAGSGAANVNIIMDGTGANALVPLWNGDNIKSKIFDNAATVLNGNDSKADYPIKDFTLTKDTSTVFTLYYLNFIGGSSKKVKFDTITTDYNSIWNGGFKLNGANAIIEDGLTLKDNTMEVLAPTLDYILEELNYVNNKKLINFNNFTLYRGASGNPANLYNNILRMVEYHVQEEMNNMSPKNIANVLPGLSFNGNFVVNSGINPYDSSGNPKTYGAFETTTDTVLYFLNKSISVRNFIANGDAYTASGGTLSIGTANKAANGVFKGSLKGIKATGGFGGATSFENTIPDEIGNSDVLYFGSGSQGSSYDHKLGQISVLISYNYDMLTRMYTQLGSTIDNLFTSKQIIDDLSSISHFGNLDSNRNIISGKVANYQTALPYKAQVQNTEQGAVHPQLNMKDFADQYNGVNPDNKPRSTGYTGPGIDNKWTVAQLDHIMYDGAYVWHSGDTIAQVNEQPVRNAIEERHLHTPANALSGDAVLVGCAPLWARMRSSGQR